MQDNTTYQGYIERCYWNYLRVYTLAETQLLDADLHVTPPRWFYREKVVLPVVDVLDNNAVFDENPDGLQGYGSLVVVPLNQERQTRFSFALPTNVVLEPLQNGQWTYRLYIQKQPGTNAIPVSIQVQLPDGAELLNAQPLGQIADGIWSANLNLHTDIDIMLSWQNHDN